MARKRERGQSAPVVYDPEAHREFVTGFRKRKQARREKAAADAQRAEKEARREDRKARQEVFRSERVLEEKNDDEEVVEMTFDGEGGEVKAFIGGMESGFDRVQQVMKGKENEEKEGRNGEEGSENGKMGKTEKGKIKISGASAKVKKGKRRVSYTHLLSKTNRRKALLKRRRANAKGSSG